MAGSESSAYLAAVKWGDEGYYLQEFTHKFTLPQVAKIIKGQYMGLGVPCLPSPSLNQTVFLASGGKRVKVAAQCVKFKDGHRVVPVGTKLAIPDNYDGWFEILSEDGRAVRCIESVAELHKRFPESCLVRECIKVHLAKADDPDSVSEKTRTIYAGDTLLLDGETHGTPGRSKARYLKCFTSKGEAVFLNTDQRGKFSPIAREDSIVGVHTIKNLLSKRFPLMVRLIHGKPPAALKSNSHFVNEMRLYSLFEEESIVALPLLKDSHLVAIPPTAPLKVQAPKNAESLLKLKEYTALVEKCKSLMQEVSDRIQIFDISLSKEFRLESKQQPPGMAHLRLKNLPYVQRVKRSMSDPHDRLKENLKVESEVPQKEPPKSAFVEENYDEIDQIYDYVRGFAPLPQKVKSDMQNEPNPAVHRSLSSGSPCSTNSSPKIVTSTSKPAKPEQDKPEPPPVETIPVRKMSTEGPPKDVHTSAPINNVCKPAMKPNEPVYKDVDLAVDHIYEKVGKRCHAKNSEIPIRVPMRSNSAGKLLIPSLPSYGVSKMFIKSPAQQRIQHKSRFFKHSKSSPALKDIPIQKVATRVRTSRSKSLTTSPLFNIRYKSLTNLTIDFNTLDSSNSGGQTSSGSGGSREFKDAIFRNRKLPRPKSLTNLFCELNHVESQNRYNIMQNDLSKGLDNRKMIFTREGANGKLLIGSHNKRIGTLYL